MWPMGLLLSIPLEVYVIFTCFIEISQTGRDDEELRLLGTEVNGEIHIISILGKFTKL